MFSLLGLTTLQAVRADLWAKQVRIIAVAGVGVFVSGCIALVPAYIDSDSPSLWPFGGVVIVDPLAEDPLAETSDDGELARQENAKQLLALAREQSQLTPVTPIIERMREVALQRGEIQLVRVALSQGVFVVVGVAPSRDVLLALRAAYRSDTEHFVSADVPIAQLSGKDGEFPFTITVVPVGQKKDDKKIL